jgi:hypothetical protein
VFERSPGARLRMSNVGSGVYINEVKGRWVPRPQE